MTGNKEISNRISNDANAGYSIEANRYREYMRNPGSNYAAGSFGGSAYGLGMQDQYRGYYRIENPERRFGNSYNAIYGNDNDWVRPENDFRANYSRDYITPYQQRYTDDRGDYYRMRNDEDRRRTNPQLTGPHKGKGPRGYNRSDERIREDE